MSDYYRTLGVKRDATAEEIRKAYKRRARKYHPDARPDDKEAAAKFKKVRRAYTVLSDPEKRAQYDRRQAESVDTKRSEATVSPVASGRPFSPDAATEPAPHRTRRRARTASGDAAFIALGLLVLTAVVGYFKLGLHPSPSVATADPRPGTPTQVLASLTKAPALPSPAVKAKLPVPEAMPPESPSRRALRAERPVVRQIAQAGEQVPVPPPVPNEPPTLVEVVPAKDADLRAIETAANRCFRAVEAVALYKRFAETHTMTAQQQEKLQANLQGWEERSKQQLVRLGEKWVAEAVAVKAHKEEGELLQQAFVMMGIPNFQEARRTLEKASRVDPNSIAADFALGLLNSISPPNLRNPKTAEKHFQIVLRRFPGYVPALNNLAIAQIRQEKYPDALRSLRAAAALSPKADELIQNLGRFVSEAKLGRIRPRPTVLNEATKLYADVVVSKQSDPAELRFGWRFMPFASPNREPAPMVMNLGNIAALQAHGDIYNDRMCSACNGKGRMTCHAPGCQHGVIYGETTTNSPISLGWKNPIVIDNPITSTTRHACPNCGGQGVVRCPFCSGGVDPNVN